MRHVLKEKRRASLTVGERDKEKGSTIANCVKEKVEPDAGFS